jgi:hypothetical protein
MKEYMSRLAAFAIFRKDEDYVVAMTLWRSDDFAPGGNPSAHTVRHGLQPPVLFLKPAFTG